MKSLMFALFFSVCFSQLAVADWKYSEKTDDFEGTNSKRAMNISTNSVDLPFPYNGKPISAMFAIAKSSKSGESVILAANNGQVVCDYQDCKIKVKFDDNEPISFDAKRSENTKGFVVTGNEALKLIEDTKASKKAVVRFSFYRIGHRDFEFNTEGLAWE